MNDRTRKQTITLELLRHGGADGQLLSPTTPYLALCGNHGAQGFHVSLDHRDFLSRREGLGYRQPDAAAREMMRGMALREATRDVSRIFAAVPGLTADLGTAEIIHMRLVLSAPELAGLPFELAEAPPGAPGEGQPLFLDGGRQVVLTREVRRGAPPAVLWPRRPRILFIAASPGHVPPVPIEAHLLALRRALDPWIGWAEDPRAEIKSHLTILPNASLTSIQEACRRACLERHPYTHVHVLTHGAEAEISGTRETRFYLALHQGPGSDEVEHVDGHRLEAALRPLPAAREALAVVTLASCDSGNAGSILAAGASTAHELHEAGIPFVVGSQFPLTYRGSVRMVDRLYQELFRGADPVLITHDVRRELHALESSGNHDYASLVVYVALPADIDRQVTEARYHRTFKAGDVALARARRAYKAPKQAPVDTSLHNALDRAVREMEALAQEAPWLAARAHGWLASLYVRWAELPHHGAEATPEPGHGDVNHAPSLGEMSRPSALQMAEGAYRRAFQRDRSLTWALVQAITMRWSLGHGVDEAEVGVARWLCAQDAKDASKRSMVADNLAQLHLLSAPRAMSPEQVEDMVWEQIETVLEESGARSFHAFALRRQMRRHATWWSLTHPMIQRIAAKMDKRLDACHVPERWDEA
jgi:CHAT domain